MSNRLPIVGMTGWGWLMTVPSIALLVNLNVPVIVTIMRTAGGPR